MTPSFYTSRGRLTAYAFACGYIERGQDIMLWREHGVYHVRKGRMWLKVHTLKQARKLYSNLKGQ